MRSCCPRCCCVRCRCLTRAAHRRHAQRRVRRAPRTARARTGLLLRQYARSQWPATRAEEQRCGRRVDLLLATSARDVRCSSGELGLRRVAVHAERDRPRQSSCRRPAPGPGHHPVHRAHELLPESAGGPLVPERSLPGHRRKDRPDARLVVAGAAPPRWLTASRRHGVEVTGWVPDIRPYLERAAVVSSRR